MLTRSLVTIVIAGVCCLVYTTSSLSQMAPSVRPGAEKSKKIQPLDNQTKSRAETKRLSGTVVSIDSVSKTLVIKGWRGETIFDIDGLKTVHRADSEDVKPGDRVRISYIEKNGKKTVKVIAVTSVRSVREKNTELPPIKLLKKESDNN